MKFLQIHPILFISLISALLIGCVASIDSRGFDTSTRMHTETKTYFDNDGYDIRGYDSDGFNRSGRDWGGYDREGYNSKGFDKKGFNKSGVDKDGYKRDGTHSKTGTQYDPAGYNKKGFNAEGYDREGFNSSGLNKLGKYKSVKLRFTSRKFVKNLKVDGFTVDWPTFEQKDFIAGSMVYYDMPRDVSRSTDVSVETEIIVEYTTYAMNGFGQHRNESEKKIKVKLPYTIGKTSYEHSLY